MGPSQLLVPAVALASTVTAIRIPHLADELTGTPPTAHTARSRLIWRRCLAAAAALVAGTALAWRLPATPVTAGCLLAAWLVFVQAGLLLTLTDLKSRRLPTPVITATAATTAVLLLIGAAAGRDPGPILAAIGGAVLLGGGYLAAAVLTPAGIGMGDVRLAALTGGLAAATGWDTVVLTAALPYLLGLPFVLGRYRRARLGAGDRHMPFGPFLVAGALTAVIITG